jgi:hypothetical protein
MWRTTGHGRGPESPPTERRILKADDQVVTPCKKPRLGDTGALRNDDWGTLIVLVAKVIEDMFLRIDPDQRSRLFVPVASPHRVVRLTYPFTETSEDRRATEDTLGVT